MAFDRGDIWLSYDLHCLSISIEIRIFLADGPFKYFLPRIYITPDIPHAVKANKPSWNAFLISRRAVAMRVTSLISLPPRN